MPSKTKTPSEKVYTKPPRPLQQTKLTRPTKVYGKRASRVKIPRQVLNDEGQTTVTQIWKDDFPVENEDPPDVVLSEVDEEEAPVPIAREENEEIYLGQDDDGSGDYGARPKKRRSEKKPLDDAQKSKKEAKGKGKRKSTGDIEPSSKKARTNRRRTGGDVSPRIPELHTQTLTQWNRSFTSTSNESEEDEELHVEYSPEPLEEPIEEPAAETSIYDITSSSQSLRFPRNVQRFSTLPTPRDALPPDIAGPSSVMGPPPSTPRRFHNREIPSSQSPATPLSLMSGSSKRRKLAESSNNTPISFSTNTKRAAHVSPGKLPDLEIDDTYDTVQGRDLSRIPKTPSKKLSPKSVRFALAGDQDSQELLPSSPLKEHDVAPIGSSPSLSKTVRFEIQDSDAESECEDVDVTITEFSRSRMSSPILGEDLEIQVQTGQEAEPETFYGGFGEETQGEATRLVDASANELSSMPPPSTKRSSPKAPARRNKTKEESMIEVAAEEEAASEELSEERTQFMESQRLSTQHKNAMSPRTSESDVFISLPPLKVTEITTRIRDHIVLNWSLPPPVTRVWIYEAQPVNLLKYAAEIGPVKRPGQIADEQGVENAAFNAKGRSTKWVAYEILQVYVLADPRPWTEIKAKGWLSKQPNRFNKAPPGVVGELTANLLNRRLFDDHDGEPEDEERSPSLSETQEAEAQLMSTMRQYTQQSVPLNDVAREAPSSDDFQELPAFIKSEPISQAHTIQNYPIPSQATTIDLSQAQTWPHVQTPQHKRRLFPQEIPDEDAVEDSIVIWESPTRPIPPSSSVKLPSPRSRSGGSSSDHHMNRVQDSLVPFSMGSSQLQVTKSQLLPDSLLVDGLGGPPEFVGDSEEEDDEL